MDSTYNRYEMCFNDFVIILVSDKPHEETKLTMYICFTPALYDQLNYKLALQLIACFFMPFLCHAWQRL